MAPASASASRQTRCQASAPPLTHDTYSAERAALSNNAQIITMGARVIGAEVAKSIADAFLKESFDANGRSAGNVKAIDDVDAKYNAR
ncbi:MAG: RpiB/LacA/LacB family sugar-phosphate isomerase [Defluviimonas denitrificans]